MDVETIKAKMMPQIEEARSSEMARRFGWGFEIDGLTLFVTLRRIATAEPNYLLRAAFDDFPKRAPSYVFVDIQTKQHTDTAWPPGVRHNWGNEMEIKPPSICTTGTRECHELIHNNDAQYSWDYEKYTVLNTIRMIHRMMG